MKKLLLAFLIIGCLTVPASAFVDTYFVKRANITTTSVTIDFGFPANTIQIQTDATNSDELCVDWQGRTATCPAANTAGDDRIPAGSVVTIDGKGSGQISVIAASGTLTVFIRAFR